MSESILLVNTMQIDKGKLEDFKESVKQSLEFVEANGSQLMVEVYIDETNMRAYSFQFHRNSESILFHWQISDPYIRNVMQHSTVKRLDIYGQPNKAVMKGIQPFSDNGVIVSVTPHFAGFSRFQPNE
ncbi:MAG: hypothetical protein KME17_00425 [Cyanosarcina radialis HA8281-LM2]|jgi:hypothetical protein|nr:hypothetical protein [Cyanosarcina radialis HA8281-LM2]